MRCALPVRRRGGRYPSRRYSWIGPAATGNGIIRITFAIGAAQVEQWCFAVLHQRRTRWRMVGVDTGTICRPCVGHDTSTRRMLDLIMIQSGNALCGERAAMNCDLAAGVQQQSIADIDDIERRPQRQQLAPHDLIAALRLLGAVPGSFLAASAVSTRGRPVYRRHGVASASTSPSPGIANAESFRECRARWLR